MTDEKSEDCLTIAWCDNGFVDGKFMQGVTDVMIHGGVNVTVTLRSNGNQIARQRERVIDHWYDSGKTDWILWVDSDVVVTPEAFRMLWEARDAVDRPLVTGVYFTTDKPEESLMVPYPTLYQWSVDRTKLIRVHPMPKNKVIKVGAAGMGFVLMHRSVVTRLREELPGVPLFTEVNAYKYFTGEDIYFYSLCARVGIPVYAHTGATVPHMKRFSFDVEYYDAFMGGVQTKSAKKKSGRRP